MNNLSVIIVAGGSGTRMGSAIPKQFIEIAGRPILMRTIEAFRSYSTECQIIVVLPESEIGLWGELCRQYNFNIVHETVCGGHTRFHSVSNGLKAVHPDAKLIAVHDGVRPFADNALIERTVKEAIESGAAIPVVAPTDSMRILDNGGSRQVDRGSYVMVQTPQVFDAHILRNAYSQPFRESFTDDASVVEASGREVTLVAGDRKNIKITTPDDLIIAETFLSVAP